MKEQLKGKDPSHNYTTDPDIQDIPPEILKAMWDKALPKLEGIKGKIIITGTPLGSQYYKEVYEAK